MKFNIMEFFQNKPRRITTLKNVRIHIDFYNPSQCFTQFTNEKAKMFKKEELNLFTFFCVYE